MIEWFSSVGSWFSRNGSASEWLTALGTTSAVILSLFFAYSKSRPKLNIDLVQRGNSRVLIVENKKSEPIYVTDLAFQHRLEKQNEQNFRFQETLYAENTLIQGYSFAEFSIWQEVNQQIRKDKHKQRASEIYVRFYVRANGKSFKSKEYSISNVGRLNGN